MLPQRRRQGNTGAVALACARTVAWETDHDRALYLDAVVIGGAALNLIGVVSRPTKDRDILYSRLTAAIAEAGRVIGPASLADQLPSGWKRRLEAVFTGEAIVLRWLKGEDLLRSKLFALCDRGIDLGDCPALAPTTAELATILPWLEQQDINPDWAAHVTATMEERRRLGHCVFRACLQTMDPAAEPLQEYAVLLLQVCDGALLMASHPGSYPGGKKLKRQWQLSHHDRVPDSASGPPSSRSSEACNLATSRRFSPNPFSAQDGISASRPGRFSSVARSRSNEMGPLLLAAVTTTAASGTRPDARNGTARRRRDSPSLEPSRRRANRAPPAE